MLVRVSEPGKPAFQLRKGEAGISVFDTEAVDPPLTETELLISFRPGSQAIQRTRTEIEAKGMQVMRIAGGESLPQRLQDAHAEVRPGPGMTRSQFKQTLQELE